MTKQVYDITIIGGGPTGLFAAFYAGMRGAKTKIIEALPELGGQLALLYPEKYIYDVAGFPKVKAHELIGNLTTQIEKFNHTICLNQEVSDILPQADQSLMITTNTQDVHYTKAVIIAAGNGAFQPRRINLEGNEALEGTSLHYAVKDMTQFSDKRVMVCGGGDSAVDWALMLEKTAAEVTLLHRRPKFRAHEYSLEQLESSNVMVKTPYVLEELEHDGDTLRAVTIYNPKEDRREVVDTDHLLINYGFSSSLGPIKKWPLERKGNTLLVNSDMSTNIPGVYAIGDIATYAGKVKLIATGFGEAPTAVNNALHFIHPEERLQPMHSTSLYG